MRTRAEMEEKIKKGVYYLYVGFFWVLMTFLSYHTCKLDIDLLLYYLSYIPGVFLLFMPFFLEEDIRGIENIKEIPPTRWPLVLFFFILSWMPFIVLIVIQDNKAYVDFVLLIGSLFIALSLHFFETGTAILTVAFSRSEEVIISKLKIISRKMENAALFCTFGGSVLLFCGILFRYDLSQISPPFTIYVFKSMLTIFGDSIFLWGVLQASSLSKWHEILDEYREEIEEYERERARRQRVRADARELSYPSGRWDFHWFKFTGNIDNPWGDFLTTTTDIDVRFDRDWGEGEVGESRELDMVGFRACRTISINVEGNRIFRIGGDDGIRLFAYKQDGSLVFRKMDGWRDQSYKVYTHEEFLEVGDYRFLLEWYERTGSARASFQLITPDT